ncbi:MAG: hypothetical protein CME64_17690 [Halobacteriovoraceae bacterium]|nr:hypothetical protein [Halobacteriovoraceae bacterium]|tara:strand:- start:42244 stop:44310 length:2067 start_codon:yes stop_codon:yes gene_type:complete
MFLKKVVSTIILSAFALSAMAQDCPSGHYMHPELNRCVMKSSTVSTKTNANRCEGMSGEAYSKCFKDNIKDELKDYKKQSKVSDGNWHRASVPLTVGLLAGYYLIINKENFKSCKATSVWLMLGGAVAGTLTEITAQLSYSKSLKKLNKKYSEDISKIRSENDEDSEATEAQTLALESMKEQERIRMKASQTRKKGHALATAIYASAVVAAIYEQSLMGFDSAVGSCLPSEAGAGTLEGAIKEGNYTPLKRPAKIKLANLWLNDEFKNAFMEFSYLEEVTLPEFAEMITRKIYQNLTISDAVANDVAVTEVDAKTPLDSIKDAGNSGLGKTIKKWVDKGMATPWIRAALAGTLSTYSNMLRTSAKKNEKISKDRIEAIDEILISFIDTGGARFGVTCSEEKMDNPSVPECYCFKEDGSPNMQRKNRQVCVTYRSKISLKAEKYSGGMALGYSPVKECITNDGKSDTDCSICKKYPQKCPVVASANLGTINLPKSLEVPSLLKQSNSLATGRLDLANLETADLNKKAARINKIREKLAEKAPYSKILQKVKNLEGKFQKATPSLFRKSFGASAPLNLASTNLKGSSSPTIADAPEKKSGNKVDINKSTMATAKSFEMPKGQTEEEFDFGFGEDDSSAGIEVLTEKEKIMNKNFSMKGDIHKGSDTNLFKILSIRYKKSALRRLFKEEEQ